MFQHTAARRRLQFNQEAVNEAVEFQHTAARRRLHLYSLIFKRGYVVSTHSRPKAAA